MTEPAFQQLSDKAPDAYRTISEVAHELALPQHVLRFWESRFGQIRPLKRGGGRRYYKPDDIALLKGIQHLLYNEGYTIKGVQKVLKTQGVKAVQAIALSPTNSKKIEYIQDNGGDDAEQVEEIYAQSPDLHVEPQHIDFPETTSPVSRSLAAEELGLVELPLFDAPTVQTQSKPDNSELVKALKGLKEDLVALRSELKSK